MYIVLKKVPEYRYPLYFEKIKNRADFAMAHADPSPPHAKRDGLMSDG